MKSRSLFILFVLFSITACNKESSPPETAAEVFFVTPNPCKNFIEYGILRANETWEISLLSPQNDLLFSNNITKAPPDTYSYDLTGEPAGSYLFEIKKDDLVFQKELVKME